MRLKAGKYEYNLPKDLSKLESVYLRNGSSYDTSLMNRPFDFDLPKTTRVGEPTSFSVSNGKIQFYPIPDKAYYVFLYYLALKVK